MLSSLTGLFGSFVARPANHQAELPQTEHQDNQAELPQTEHQDNQAELPQTEHTKLVDMSANMSANMSELDKFFSDNIGQVLPDRISRNQHVTEVLFIAHPELIYAPTFGENPNFSLEFLESHAEILNYNWMSSTKHVKFLAKFYNKIVWSVAAANEAFDTSDLLQHEAELTATVCDNSNFNEAYFESRINRGLPVDGCRLSANKSISAAWLIKHNLFNWFWYGYNASVDNQFMRDNYTSIKFDTYSFNKAADFELIDRYYTENPHVELTHVCYNPAVPRWFLDKYIERLDMAAVGCNPGVPLDFIKAHLDKVPINALAYRGGVPAEWLIKNKCDDWHSMSYKLSCVTGDL
jgi:hypothetical protein